MTKNDDKIRHDMTDHAQTFPDTKKKLGATKRDQTRLGALEIDVNPVCNRDFSGE